ncbi:DNA (cytosine-5-)-methyltransferase [Gregarina niphandrodes]|uniref:DNA (Cytosine-5-)-methyltransferase n=1 Tax=Gregarina niphandrodes TaxID=110365 RepID=A0A023B6U3_GRENI|nr:DNA (cytosine-5-)-methyltransferase [Gregarina niphandrodes]EZG66764.1 DNA (cytosine-5-)-methyltransferase [Gregarina niphandrodes]|eukprot:XP_011130495.1 DNA (cytosine-5-)-methyltransferase [Gregarina niphandrodes]
MNGQHCLRVVSLFAGIGGLTCALDELGLRTELVCMLDISRECRMAWLEAKGRGCMPGELKALESKYMVKDIMTVDFGGIGDADIWLISPPCQPFTKGGKELHEEDARAQPFLRVIEVLQDKQPPFVFIENVPGFGASDSYTRFRKAMEANYDLFEYYQSPTDIGIPYERSRFYCVARRRDLGKADRTGANQTGTNQTGTNQTGTNQTGTVQTRTGRKHKPLSAYVDRNVQDEKYFIPPSKLAKMENFKFDLVDLDFLESRGPVGTFTGGYGEYLGKTGPVMRMGPMSGKEGAGDRFQTVNAQVDRVRRFTPNEILALHGFPKEWYFDADSPFSLRLQYKLVGNSVSVDVIADILRPFLVTEKMDEGKSGEVLNADQLKQYDRQIRLWGYDAQVKMMSNRVCLMGVDGVTMEVGKNLAAAGVNVDLFDDVPYEGQLVSVIPRENMFAPEKSVAVWYEKCLRRMNALVGLGVFSEVPERSTILVSSLSRAASWTQAITSIKRAPVAQIYVVTETEVLVGIGDPLHVVRSLQEKVRGRESDILSPSECAIIGGLITQCVTTHIQQNETPDWDLIEYNRSKIAAKTLLLNERTNAAAGAPAKINQEIIEL